MLDHNDITQKVLEIAPENINLIVIFTSFQEKEQRFKLRLQVISLLEGPSQPVDVVILEDSNWTLRHRVARDGVVIFQKNENTWANFVEQVLIFYPDHRIFEQQFLRDTLGGS